MTSLPLLLLAAISSMVLLQGTEASFSFALPGNWGGSSKRGFNFALPGKWGNVKRDGKIDCGDIDGNTVLSIYKAIHEEASRLHYCLAQAPNADNEVNKQ